MCAFFLALNRKESKSGRKQIAQLLLSELDTEAIAEERGGYTVLSLACKSGLEEAAKLILEHSPSLVNAGTPHPLWIAASEGHAGILQVLLSRKNREIIPRGVVAPDGTTPLMMVIAKADRDAFNALRSFYDEKEMLLEVVNFGSMKLLGEIIEFSRDGLSRELLPAAIASEQTEMVEEILLNKKDENQKHLTSTKLGILKLLGKEETHHLSSNLTRLSAQFPLFNSNVEGDKPQCGRGRIKLNLTQLDSQILDAFCCTTEDLTNVDTMVDRCSTNCRQ